MLRCAADVAREIGDGSLRMSPWQSLVLTNIDADRSEQALAALSAQGLLCDSQAPLARVTACTGAGGCAKAQAETKADAVVLGHPCCALVLPAACICPAA